MIFGSRINLFVLISGFGWLVDFLLLGFLVSRGGEAAVANFISASAAASIVYWVSGMVVFKRKLCVQAVLGYFKYYIYSAFAIVVFSIAIQLVSEGLGFVCARGGVQVSVSTIVLASKVLMTPFNLLLNYFVANRIQKGFGGFEND